MKEQEQEQEQDQGMKRPLPLVGNAIIDVTLVSLDDKLWILLHLLHQPEHVLVSLGGGH